MVRSKLQLICISNGYFGGNKDLPVVEFYILHFINGANNESRFTLRVTVVESVRPFHLSSDESRPSAEHFFRVLQALATLVVVLQQQIYCVYVSVCKREGERERERDVTPNSEGD